VRHPTPAWPVPAFLPPACSEPATRGPDPLTDAAIIAKAFPAEDFRFLWLTLNSPREVCKAPPYVRDNRFYLPGAF